MRYFSYFFLTLFLSVHNIAHIMPSPTDYYILTAPGWNPGFFCCFQTVVGFLKFYETHPCAGIEVNFEQGLYFDAQKGPNWWEYYFEPIRLGTKENANIISISDGEKSDWSTAAISTISRKEAGTLIKKYIRLKPHIKQKVFAFMHENFKNKFIIGVHYRGTDKSSEAPRVKYDVVARAIKTVIEERELGIRDYKIFIATDEQAFVTYMEKQFKNVIYTPAMRSISRKPIHYQRRNPAQHGEECLIDCLLLSRCSLLIRTHSNVSSSAGNINPYLPIIDLNHPTYCPSLRNLERPHLLPDEHELADD